MKDEQQTRPVCWGCECEVPLLDGMHVEETDIPGLEYAYPCAGPRQVFPVQDGDRKRWA